MADPRSARSQASALGQRVIRRGLGAPALFAIAYGTAASAVYFSLGVIADNALGLTPLVFLGAALFFVLCQMTYVEGASMRQEATGSSAFARYAFNELWSFVAGWALLLDYVILIAITTLTATNYIAAFIPEIGEGALEVVVAIGLIALIAASNIRGLTASRFNRIAVLAVVDLLVQLLLIVLGLALVFNVGDLVDPIQLGSSPSWSGVIFGLTIAAAPFIALESGSGLAGELRVRRQALRHLIVTRNLSVVVIYFGIAVVALCALPVVNGKTGLGAPGVVDAPLLGVVGALDPGAWWSDPLRYLVAITGALVLVIGAQSAMLGLSRLTYSLSTNRQIPSAAGRLHSTRATPYVAIMIAAVLASALIMPLNLSFLIGIFAYGAMLAFTIAHLSICVLRYRDPDRHRPYRMPFSVRIAGGDLPIPAALGFLLSLGGWISVIVLHKAGYVGTGWMIFGLLLYVVYRKRQGTPILRRVSVPEAALRHQATEVEYGRILVPLLGTTLDDDIVGTAGRLAAVDVDDEDLEDEGAGGATIEALWVFEVPMSLPIDAPMPDAQFKAARRALARAKAVGEEYEGVTVATTTVRARRTGQAIVDEARRRGVEVIVMAAEEPSKVRAGALLGGRGGPLENFGGDITRYVVNKAPCRVILTAPGVSIQPAKDGDVDTQSLPPIA